MNTCTACEENFSSVETFDRHRVGVHAYTFLEGMRMDPPVEDGRRCLSPDEMVDDRGWAWNLEGVWYDPARTERAREAFSALGREP